MKESLQAGLETTTEFTVDAERVTRHMGEDLGVYATPFLIRDIERTCRGLIEEHVDAGEDSVGTYFDLQHKAPALEGAHITIHARLLGVDRRAVTFEAVVHDEVEELASCRHGRFVVEKAKLKQRLEDKAAKLRGE